MKPIRHCFFAFLLLSLLVAPLRGGYCDFGPFQGLILSSFAGSILGYFLLWYFLSKKNDVRVLIAALAGMFICTLPMHIFRFHETAISFLEACIHFLAICGAFVSFRYFKKKGRAAFTALLFCGLCWLSLPGYHMYIYYLNFGTFTGKLKAREMSDIYRLQTEAGDTIRLSDWHGKYVLLDFWSRYCGLCWKAFPKVQSLYEAHKESPDVLVAGVFLPYKQDDWESVKDRFHETCSFPVYHATQNDTLLKALSIQYVPTYVVLDKEGKLRYKGDFEGAKKFLEGLKRNE